MRTNKVKPTGIQKKAVDNIVSGKFGSLKDAMLDAGYSKSAADKPKVALAQKKGVQIYLQQLDQIAKKAWNMSVEEKVMLTYLEGLEATTLKGRNAQVEHPDWMTRKAFADKFAEFFGWVRGDVASGGIRQQFNFFGMPEEQREAFNTNFKGFLKQYYESSSVPNAGRA